MQLHGQLEQGDCFQNFLQSCGHHFFPVEASFEIFRPSLCGKHAGYQRGRVCAQLEKRADIRAIFQVFKLSVDSQTLFLHCVAMHQSIMPSILTCVTFWVAKHLLNRISRYLEANFISSFLCYFVPSSFRLCYFLRFFQLFVCCQTRPDITLH